MEITIKNKKLKCRVCSTPKQKMEGMQNKTFDGFDCMLFLLGTDYDCFWMKDCIIDLDILFLNEKFEIVKIFNSCEKCDSEDCPRYCSSGNYVLELPSKYCQKNKIKIGDRIILPI